MKGKKLENFRNKISLAGCKWSNLNAPRSETRLSHLLFGDSLFPIILSFNCDSDPFTINKGCAKTSKTFRRTSLYLDLKFSSQSPLSRHLSAKSARARAKTGNQLLWTWNIITQKTPSQRSHNHKSQDSHSPRTCIHFLPAMNHEWPPVESWAAAKATTTSRSSSWAAEEQGILIRRR